MHIQHNVKILLNYRIIMATRKDNILKEAKPSKRTFTLVSSDVPFPKDAKTRYKSNDPGNAAKKAGKRVFNETKTKKKQIRITLRDTTRGGTLHNTLYTYVVSKVKLEKPVVLNLKGKEITYEYEYNVKACE